MKIDNRSNTIELLKEIIWILFVPTGIGLIMHLALFIYSKFSLQYDTLFDGLIDGVSLGVIIALSSVCIIVGFFNIKKWVQTQKIWNEQSWVYYAYFGIAFTPLFFELEKSFFSQNFSANYFIYPTLISDLLLLAGIILYVLIPEINLDDIRYRYAPNAVSLNKDKFYFKGAAELRARSLELLMGNVSVVALLGPQGYGKSSFVRMMIETIPRENALYTYVSLTESNDARNFSKLFAERWFETISQRYPKIDHYPHSKLMSVLLRESSTGFLSAIIEILVNNNFGLLKSISASQDSYTSSEVAEIFGSINVFKERQWFIIIDEIERARPEEIYRVVEMLERFKILGENNIPIKIVFILCIADDVFARYMKEYGKEGHELYLSEQFFFGGTKSFDLRFFLPPVTTDVKLNYIKSLLEGQLPPTILKENQVNLQDLIGVSHHQPEKIYLRNSKEFLNYILDKLTYQQPRLIGRVVFDVVNYYQNLINHNLAVDGIYFGNILALSYIKQLKPELYNFIANMAGRFHVQDRGNSMAEYFASTRVQRANKDNFVGWLESQGEFIGVTKEELAGYVPLIGLVSYFLISDDFVRDFQSTSDPTTLFHYLSDIRNLDSEKNIKLDRYYKQHQVGKLDLKLLNNAELAHYAHFVNIQSQSHKFIHEEVLGELVKRFDQGYYKSSPEMKTEFSDDYPIYQIVFHFNKTVRYEDTESLEPSKKTKFAFEQISKFFQSSAVNIEQKLIILNVFVNEERNGNKYSREFELVRNYYKSQIDDLVIKIFKEFNDKYIIGSDVIYDEIENPRFVMYQWWSGDPNNTNELRKIKLIALRGLRNHKEMIESYWESYPYDDGITNFKELIEYTRYNSFRDVATSPYMDLVTLIRTSQDMHFDEFLHKKISFYKKILSDPEQRQDLHSATYLKPDKETLKASLINKNILPPDLLQ